VVFWGQWGGRGEAGDPQFPSQRVRTAAAGYVPTVTGGVSYEIHTDVTQLR